MLFGFFFFSRSDKFNLYTETKKFEVTIKDTRLYYIGLIEDNFNYIDRYMLYFDTVSMKENFNLTPAIGFD
jgi:hypothetical protein